MQKFNLDFYLGAASAAHQVEGNNVHSDYWAMEHMKYTSFTEPSLDAVDHYNRYEEDIELLADAGLNTYRFSIEWARIEPAKGQFDEKEIQHYRDVIKCCLEHNVEPIVTLHHFSSPKWLITEGGWEKETTIGYFENYARYIAQQLGSDLKYICTINEANMGLQIAAISKRYMKQMKAMANAKASAEQTEGSVQVGLNMQKMMENQQKAAVESAKIFEVSDPRMVQTFTSQRTPEGDILIMRAHQAARAAIKSIMPSIKVGLSLSLHDIQILPGGEENGHTEWEEEFLHYLPYIEDDDFLGVQNYTRSRIDADGIMATPEGAELTQMNYEFYPQALENVIREVAKHFKNDILVTENGIGTSDDQRRIAFIDEALRGVQSCIKDGIPVKGYMHWTLLDNFEWQKGFSMTFGLISVDRSTQKRTPKGSLKHLGSYR